MKFGEIARLLSAEYTALSHNQKAVWIKLSEDDRLRFKREMLSYTPPPPTMDLNNAIVGSSTAHVGTSRESAEYSGDDSMVDKEVHAPEAKKAKKGIMLSFWILINSYTPFI